MDDLIRYTGNPLILLLMGVLIPPIVSFLKAWHAREQVAAAIQWVVTLVMIGLSMVLDSAFDDFPDDHSLKSITTYMITKLAIIVIVTSAWYRNAWRPSGADEAVAKQGPQIGAKP